MPKSAITAVVLVTMFLLSNLHAQKEHSFHADEANYHVRDFYQLEITPSPTKRRSALNSFIKDDFELTQGNAAISYFRACLHWQVQPQKIRDQFYEKGNQWLKAPLDEMPVDEVTDFLANFNDVLAEFDKAVQSRDCDWNFRLDQMSFAEFANANLQELSVLRSIMRLNQLRTRLFISQKKFDLAHDSIVAAFKVARDVDQYGFASATHMSERFARTALQSVLELSQASGAPNNLLSLRSLPSPWVDYGPKIRAEQNFLESSFPFLLDPESSNRTPEQWKQVFVEFVQQLDSISGRFQDKLPSQSDLENRTTLLVARLYPIAKRELIERGWEKSEVEKMPAAKVIAIQTRHVWNECISFGEGLTQLTASESEKIVKTRRDEFRKQGFNRPMSRGQLPLSYATTSMDLWQLQPTSRSVNHRIEFLKAIELLRDFAARHQELPTQEQFLKLNMPPDSASNQPLSYERLTKTSAILQTPVNINKDYPQYRSIRSRAEIDLKLN